MRRGPGGHSSGCPVPASFEGRETFRANTAPWCKRSATANLRTPAWGPERQARLTAGRPLARISQHPLGPTQEGIPGHLPLPSQLRHPSSGGHLSSAQLCHCPYHTPSSCLWGFSVRSCLCPQEGALSASLVVQWLRIRLPMQGTWVRALVWEDPTCRGATKPVRHNY